MYDLAYSVSHVLSYGHEFFGSPARLVITPQVERARLSITEALNAHVGCLFYGPSSVGKSETIGDFAHALGRHFLLFNCSKNFSAKVLSKILMGVLQIGSWICFDGLLTIKHSELALLASHLRNISNAVAERSEKILFKGKTVRIDESCGIFATDSK